MIWFIFILAVVGFFAVYETVCILTGRPTLSQKVWQWIRVTNPPPGPWPWQRSVFAVGFGLLAVWLWTHLVYGRQFIWF